MTTSAGILVVKKDWKDLMGRGKAATQILEGFHVCQEHPELLGKAIEKAMGKPESKGENKEEIMATSLKWQPKELDAFDLMAKKFRTNRSGLVQWINKGILDRIIAW